MLADQRCVQTRARAEKTHKLVLIMLTDSGDANRRRSQRELDAIMQEEARHRHDARIALHMIGVGKAANVEFVQQLAACGHGSPLVCQCADDMDRLELV